jgi:hypothetical protein
MVMSMAASYRVTVGGDSREPPSHAAATAVTIPPKLMAQAGPNCSDSQPI